jgi:hypothetical protein
MRISDYSRHTRQGGNFLRRALRVTAGHHDLAIGILALNSPNGGARVLVGGRGYGTCIEYDNVGGIQSGCCFQATFAELALYSGAVGLRRSTAKILYVKARHSHIVTYVAVRAGELLLIAKLGEVLDEAAHSAGR